MDYLEFIARMTTHIPNKGQVTVRYLGLYAHPSSRDLYLFEDGKSYKRSFRDLAWGSTSKRISYP